MKNQKKLVSLLVLCLFITSCTCSTLIFPDSKVQVKKRELVSYKKRFIQDRIDVINLENVSEEKIDAFYIPMVEGIQVKLNLRLEQGKTIDSHCDDKYQVWSNGVDELGSNLNILETTLSVDKGGDNATK